jgi:ATP-dependent DNA helicase RecQ
MILNEQDLSTAIHQVLKKYWGYDLFRSTQQEIITKVAQGHNCLGVMPTGAGKSICYQVPGLLHEGVTLVISPLIALMKDQISGLKNKGIKAVGIYSGQTKRTQDILLDNAIYGEVKFLFVSPERLRTHIFRERFRKMNVSFVAVDEAHCISEWGHDFRPEYRMIADLREIHPELAFLALTATATKSVVDDICDNLNIQPEQALISSPIRTNLSYAVVRVDSKKELIASLVKGQQGCTIIYVNTRKATKEIERYLKERGTPSMAYHGGMSKKDRDKVSEAWTKGATRVIVATKAFGMGIDKADVRRVIHYNVPQSLEAYVQEAGRAGRDGHSAEAILLYNPADFQKFDKLINESFPSIEYIRDIYSKVSQHLKVAAGPTDLEFYPFYIADFCNKNNLKKNVVANTLKSLHQAEVLFLSEAILHPSQLHLKEGECKALLRNPRLSPKMQEFVKLLLRTYEGLFMDFAVIDEFHLAKKFQVDQKKIVAALQWLQKKDIAVYRPTYEGHTISFNAYRYRKEDMPIDEKAYAERKKRMTSSIDAILDYIKKDVCRQQQIAAYFSFKEEPCQGCDICIEANQNISKYEIKTKIEDVLINEPLTLLEVYGKFKMGERKAVEDVLADMEAERELNITGNKLELRK